MFSALSSCSCSASAECRLLKAYVYCISIYAEQYCCVPLINAIRNEMLCNNIYVSIRADRENYLVTAASQQNSTKSVVQHKACVCVCLILSFISSKAVLFVRLPWSWMTSSCHYTTQCPYNSTTHNSNNNNQYVKSAFSTHINLFGWPKCCSLVKNGSKIPNK